MFSDRGGGGDHCQQVVPAFFALQCALEILDTTLFITEVMATSIVSYCVDPYILNGEVLLININFVSISVYIATISKKRVLVMVNL